MSEGRVETVRAIYEQWAHGDFRAGTELYDPSVLLILRPEFPDPGAYCGPEEIARYMREDFSPTSTAWRSSARSSSPPETAWSCACISTRPGRRVGRQSQCATTRSGRSGAAP